MPNHAHEMSEITQVLNDSKPYRESSRNGIVSRK